MWAHCYDSNLAMVAPFHSKRVTWLSSDSRQSRQNSKSRLKSINSFFPRKTFFFVLMINLGCYNFKYLNIFGFGCCTMKSGIFWDINMVWDSFILIKTLSCFPVMVDMVSYGSATSFFILIGQSLLAWLRFVTSLDYIFRQNCLT